MSIATATFGAGCFWCIEAAFNNVAGVTSAVSGYMGGALDKPDYHSVCSGTTGHAEVVQVSYDSDKIDFNTLLLMLFSLHDPTQLNRQGNDVGTQYRSVVFYHDQQQKQLAEQMIIKLTEDRVFPEPIVTELSQVETFYPAEDYHQGYFEQNPAQAYCAMVVSPKLSKFKQTFTAHLKD